MFRKWLKSREVCNECGFRFNRGEDDYFIGAYTLNLIVAELIVVAAMIAVMVALWPDVPWSKLTWALVLLAILSPIATYPYSKSVWLAIDLQFRPAEPADFID